MPARAEVATSDLRREAQQNTEVAVGMGWPPLLLLLMEEGLPSSAQEGVVREEESQRRMPQLQEVLVVVWARMVKAEEAV